MRGHFLHILILLLLNLVLLPACLGAPAMADGSRRMHKILVVNSYHRGFKWTDSITSGIESVLATGPDALSRQVEHIYMDTKRLYTPEYLQKLREIYRFRFHPGEFDVLIATDNNALDFLVNYRDEIFGPVPVVFCGINDYEPALLKGQPGYTGVNERPDLAGNIDLIRRLQPNLKRLVIIEDDTPTGRRTHRQLERLLPRYRQLLDIQLVSRLSMDEMQRLVAGLSDDCAVLYTTFFRDRTGAFFEADQSASLISHASRVPVYATWDFSLGYGVIGGKLTDGFSQGEAAGRIVLRILAGEPPASIPVVMETPSRYLFDYEVLRRFGLNRQALPPESLLINEPTSRYAALLLRSSITIAVLALLLGGLLISSLRRRRAEAAARRFEGRLRAIYDNSVVGIGVIDRNGRYLQMNRAQAGLLGIDAETAGAHTIDMETPEEERSLRHEAFRQLAGGRSQSFRHERRFLRADGREFWGDQSVVPVADGDGKVESVICLTVDVTERRRAEEEIRQLAFYDPLTNLPNRILLLERLNDRLHWAQRNNSLLTLLFLDLDRFKDVNDNLGHDAGDRMLQQVAERLKGCLRATDTVARLGGDEFVVLLPALHGRTDIERLTRNILHALRDPFPLEGQEIYTTSSIGAALFPYDGINDQQLLKHADMAMYAAKEKGGNTCRFFSIDLHQRSSERLHLEADLRQALNRDEFHLEYQPQYDLASGRLTGVEALLRWHHPQRGLVPPGDFIPLTEETGLIRPLGEWVLRTACAQAGAWQRVGNRPLRLAVNLSPIQLNQPDLVDVVEEVLRQTGLSPHLLELELTESAFMQNADDTIDTLTDLKIRGVALAIDDFGTGYSSLNYLKNFPIDRLKIDRSFVRDLLDDPDDAVIVETIIAMARNLKLTVIAEGVENAEQLEVLRRLGCGEGQGFFLGRPMAAEAIGRLLETPDRPPLPYFAEPSPSFN